MKTPATVVAGVDFGDADFAARVREGVARVEDLMSTELGKADELMAEAVSHLFQAGGKRFRPLFTVLSAQLGPEPDAWQVTVAGAVIELVHLATLYHDDVMDEAQVRRGADSANARWGNNIAILAGDYLFATASRLVSRLGPEAVRIIASKISMPFCSTLTPAVMMSPQFRSMSSDMREYISVLVASLMQGDGL